jgi:bacteriorhodopsin
MRSGILTLITMAVVFLITIVAFLQAREPYNRKIYGFEALVLCIAFCFYLLMMQSNCKASLIHLRYLDWILTTPLMLIVLIFLYPVDDHFKHNPAPVMIVCLMTVLMVIIGWMFSQCTLGWKIGSTGFGFFILIAIFLFIYKFTGVSTAHSQTAFWYTVVIWSLYGIVYLMPFVVRNTSYNLLDILAKPVFGILLVANVFRIQKPVKSTENKVH